MDRENPKCCGAGKGALLTEKIRGGSGRPRGFVVVRVRIGLVCVNVVVSVFVWCLMLKEIFLGCLQLHASLSAW